MNVQYSLLSVTNKLPFQDHLPSETIISTWGSVSKKTWTKSVQSRIFLSVTNDWSSQDHLLCKLSYRLNEFYLPGDLNSKFVCLYKYITWRCGGWVDSTLDSESTCCWFESLCCHLADYITSFGKMWMPCLPLPREGMGTARLILAVGTPLKFNGAQTLRGYGTKGLKQQNTHTHNRSRQLKWSAIWPFWSCDAITTSIGVTWYWCCHQWH